jgi:hypothetical protein
MRIRAPARRARDADPPLPSPVPELVVLAVVLLLVAGVGVVAARRLRAAYRCLRDEAREVHHRLAEQRQVVGAAGMLMPLRQAAWEVEQARDGRRVSGPVAARLLEYLRRLGDEIAALERPY